MVYCVFKNSLGFFLIFGANLVWPAVGDTPWLYPPERVEKVEGLPLVWTHLSQPSGKLQMTTQHKPVTAN